jgi:DNA-binding MarR family transcriptional regulator
MRFVEQLRNRFGRRRRSVDLDLVQQWAVLTLLRFGDCSFGRLQAEVEAIRGATPADMVRAVIALEQDELLVRITPRTEGRQASTYRLTQIGRKAGRRIPRPPRSPVTIYF